MNHAKFNISTTFTGFLLGGLSASLRRVQAVDALSDERLREQALYILKVALETGQEVWPNARMLLLEMSSKMEQGGYWDEWIPILEQGIALSQEMGDLATEAIIRLDLGMLHRHRGAYAVAQEHFTQSVDFFAQSQQQQREARARAGLAYVIHCRGEYTQAVTLSSQALALAAEGTDIYAYCSSVLGVISYGRQSWQTTAEYFLAALQIYQQQGNRRETARNLLNLGATKQGQEAYAEAIRYNQEALTIFEEIDDPVHCALIQMNQGVIYSLLHKPKEALICYLSAKPIFEKVKDKMHLAQIYTNLAIAYRSLHQWEQSETICLKGLQYWEELNDVWHLVNTMDELSLIYIEKRQFGHASSVLKKSLRALKMIQDDPRHDALYKSLTKRYVQLEPVNITKSGQKMSKWKGMGK